MTKTRSPGQPHPSPTQNTSPTFRSNKRQIKEEKEIKEGLKELINYIVKRKK